MSPSQRKDASTTEHDRNGRRPGKKNDAQGYTSEEWRVRFGAALAAARRARGLSQHDLGQSLASATRNATKVVQATISSWESGTTVPSAEQLFALEKILGVHLGAYLGQEIPGMDNKKGQPLAAAIAHDPNIPEVMRPVVLAMYLAACGRPEPGG